MIEDSLFGKIKGLLAKLKSTRKSNDTDRIKIVRSDSTIQLIFDGFDTYNRFCKQLLYASVYEFDDTLLGNVGLMGIVRDMLQLCEHQILSEPLVSIDISEIDDDTVRILLNVFGELAQRIQNHNY